MCCYISRLSEERPLIQQLQRSDVKIVTNAEEAHNAREEPLSTANNLPMALVLCLLSLVLGGLESTVQLLDLDLLKSQLLALLQKLFLQPVHFVRLAG